MTDAQMGHTRDEHETGAGGAAGTAVAEPETAARRGTEIKAQLGLPVLYRLRKDDIPRSHDHLVGQQRPGAITAVHGPKMANLVVFLDGTNDGALAGNAPFLWVTSVELGEGPGTWAPNFAGQGPIDSI